MIVEFGLREMTLAKDEKKLVADFRRGFEDELEAWRGKMKKNAQVVVANILGHRGAPVSRKDVERWTARFLELTAAEPQFRPSFVSEFFHELATRR